MELFLAQYAAVSGITILIGLLIRWVYKWINPPYSAVLPPGSMGFPVVGETLQFLKKSPSLDIPNYYRLRFKRYGPVFKTRLFGQPVVVSMDAEVNSFVFQQEGKLFRTWYPGSLNSLIASYDGHVHKYIKNFASRILRDLLLSEMEQNVRQSLAAWAAERSVEVQGGLSRGRKNVQKVLRDLLKERLSTPENRHGDSLDQVVDELQSGMGIMDEQFALDILAALLFASMSAISLSLTVGMKYLTDNPNVVQALEEEHESILKRRENASSGITWEEYKSMTFTSQVINEILRLSNVAPGIFREALADVQIKGYTIPCGWLVMISPMSIHLNPELFEDPMTFNPWRWKDETKRALLKNFMPFGGGRKLCAGGEFSRIQMAVFLHTLVTKYRWKEIGGGEALRMSGMLFVKDYHIQVICRN